MRKLLLILVALLAGFIVTAQNGLNKDSLLHLLTAAKEDTAKVKLLNNLAKATKNSDIAASYKYTADALALSEKNKL